MRSYELPENINLKKSNIESENQRKIEIRYMFLLKTLGILAKRCKKTLQESTLYRKRISRQKHSQKFSKNWESKKERFN